MPTEGTHNPDAPYVACSDMAWGPKGTEHMKSASDMEYEEKVRHRKKKGGGKSKQKLRGRC